VRLTRTAVAAAMLALAWPLAPSHAQLPTLGDAGDMTANVERRLGDRIAREIYRDPDYLDDPVLVEYVGGIWQPLLQAARARGDLTNELDERLAWEIMLDRDREINAFAMPGGYLGVNLGLIAVVNSRDELASVLGHELSHVTQRHISRVIAKQGQQAPWVLAGMLLGVLMAGRSPDAGNALMVGSQAVSAQTQLNFSRDMEREADRLGYGVMSQAGFDPQGFVTMFDKLQQASRLNDYGNFPYLRSHPLTSERIADMQARQQLMPHNGANSHAAMEHYLITARARVLAQPGVDALRALVGEASATTAVTLPRERLGGVLYGATLASLKLRDFGVAQGHLKRLFDLAQGDAAATRQARLLGAELALAEGNPARAMELLKAQAQAAASAASAAETSSAPNPSAGRPEVLLASQAMLAAGQAPLLAANLQAWVALHPRDASVWQQLSAAYTAQGQTLRAIRADAEAHVAQLDYAGAMNRFRAAQEVARAGASRGAVDHIEASIIDSRARKVAALLKEQSADKSLER
jgi:predicted Zn-dependent protease